MRLGGTAGNRYELVASLGSGAFGVAWEARDRHEQQDVAVKLLHPSTVPDNVLMEAQLQRRLSEHPRIVSIRNVELGANPSSFVVLDLVRTGSIKDVTDVRRPTILESVRWLRDVLEALDHAHQENVLHRDIKPSNLLLGPDGHAMLTDFGVAEDSLTGLGPNPGMYPVILPPEFGIGTPTSVQTDIWLVGILGWQMLVGTRPDLSAAHSGKLLAPHRHSLEVPIALSRALMPALSPDPTDRPESAQRMLEEIGKVPIVCGWHDIPGRTANTVRAWRADSAGGEVIVEMSMAIGFSPLAAT
jgi:serine/threonine protein kinase